MPQYEIAFAEKLSQVAKHVIDDGIEDVEAQRTVLYLSLLSVEIAFKAMLEKAGKPVAEIRARSHNLVKLLEDLDRCNIEVEIVPGQAQTVSASRIRAGTLRHGGAETTIGEVINAPSGETSQYPNGVRYGDQLRHYPPEVMAQMAAKVVTFARENCSGLRMQ